jgi:hypothetical protein
MDLTVKQQAFIRVMASCGVSFRMSNTASLTTWYAGEFALRYKDGEALQRAGFIAYSGSKALAPYYEAWHVTAAGFAYLEVNK